MFVSERVRANDKETKMKREMERNVSEGHYETNNPSHPEKTAGASWTASQPVDLWQCAEVRLKGESQYNSRGATNTCNITTFLLKKKSSHPSRGHIKQVSFRLSAVERL